MIPPGYVSIRNVYIKFFQRYDIDAMGRLTFYLRTGELQAFDFCSRGQRQSIRAEFWQGISDDIRHAIFEKGIHAITLPRMPFREIVVLEDDLVKVLPPENNAISVDLPRPPRFKSRSRAAGRTKRSPMWDLRNTEPAGRVGCRRHHDYGRSLVCWSVGVIFTHPRFGL